MLASICLTTIYSCSNNENEIDKPETIQKNIVFQDCYTDGNSTGLEKALAYIDSYNAENDIYAKSSIITFVSNIDDCTAKIIQSTELNSSEITQKITTYCKVKTSYMDDYIPSPDYLSRHYTRTLLYRVKKLYQQQYADIPTAVGVSGHHIPTTTKYCPATTQRTQHSLVVHSRTI